MPATRCSPASRIRSVAPRSSPSPNRQGPSSGLTSGCVVAGRRCSSMCEGSEWAATFDGPPAAPVLVLGNSLGTSRRVWDRQVPALRAHFRLLSYELPGHGGSAAAPGSYTMGQLGSGLLALLDAHGIKEVAYCGI